MIKELIKLSTHLDAKGLKKESDYLDTIIKQAGVNVMGAFGSKRHPEIRALIQVVEAAGWQYQMPTGDSMSFSKHEPAPDLKHDNSYEITLTISKYPTLTPEYKAEIEASNARIRKQKEEPTDK